MSVVMPRRGIATLGVGLALTITALSLGVISSSAADASTSGSEQLASLAQRHGIANDAGALFAHDSSGGSARRTAGSRGEWTVRFKGVPRKALVFEDRPGRSEDPIGMERMLAGFFAKPGTDPPNAALSFETRGGDRRLLGVELLGGRYDRDRRVARYRFRSLKQHAADAVRPPRHFGDASVFIDDVFANYCGEIVVNGTGDPLTLTASDKAEHSGWDLQGWVDGDDDPGGPPPASIASGGWGIFGNGSAFAHGCWNNAGYQGPNGTVEFSVSTPYSDPNTWSCTTTGNYVCYGVRPYFNDGVKYDIDYDSTASSSGGLTAVIYVICPVSQPTCTAGYNTGPQ
jgi:hypothetical protein